MQKANLITMLLAIVALFHTVNSHLPSTHNDSGPITIGSGLGIDEAALLDADGNLGSLSQIPAELLLDASNAHKELLPELVDLASTTYRHFLTYISSIFNRAVNHFGSQENPVICLTWKRALAQKERALEIQQGKIATQRLIIYACLVLIVVGSVSGYYLGYWMRRYEEEREEDLEVDLEVEMEEI